MLIINIMKQCVSRYTILQLRFVRVMRDLVRTIMNYKPGPVVGRDRCMSL